MIPIVCLDRATNIYMNYYSTSILIDIGSTLKHIMPDRSYITMVSRDQIKIDWTLPYYYQAE